MSGETGTGSYESNEWVCAKYAMNYS